MRLFWDAACTVMKIEETHVLIYRRDDGEIARIGACVHSLMGWKFVPAKESAEPIPLNKYWKTYQLCIPQWARNKQYITMSLSDFDFLYQPTILQLEESGECAMADEKEFTLEDFLGEFGLKDKVIEQTVKAVSTRKAGSTPRTDFIDAVEKQLIKATEAAKTHTITQKAGPDGQVLIMEKSEALAPPTRGKPSNWFTWKNNQLVVSSYASNAAVFPPVAFKTWDDAFAYFKGLIVATNAGKLDAKFAAIKAKRAENKAKKAGANPETGEIED